MKLLVVGCGSIGRRHAGHAARLAEVAVFDRDASLAESVARECGARAFPRLEDALDWGPQGAVIAVPHRAHLPTAHSALRAGAHVLVEKPLSHSMDGVEAFLSTVRASGRRAYGVCNMRFHPGPDALQRALPSLGRPLFARAHVGNYLPAMRPGRDYRQLYAAQRIEGGGAVLDTVHEIDYLSWMLGPVSAVSCRAERLGDLDIDVEDHALLSLTLGPGVRASAEVDYLRARKSRGCEIVGTGGVLSWHSDGKAPERCRVRFARHGAARWEDVVRVDEVDTDAPYRALMEAFAKEIVQPGATRLAAAAEAATTLRAALAALRSSALDGALQTLTGSAQPA